MTFKGYNSMDEDLMGCGYPVGDDSWYQGAYGGGNMRRARSVGDFPEDSEASGIWANQNGAECAPAARAPAACAPRSYPVRPACRPPAPPPPPPPPPPQTYYEESGCDERDSSVWNPMNLERYMRPTPPNSYYEDSACAARGGEFFNDRNAFQSMDDSWQPQVQGYAQFDPYHCGTPNRRERQERCPPEQRPRNPARYVKKRIQGGMNRLGKAFTCNRPEENSSGCWEYGAPRQS